jgi:opacity protein-like surface antigen
LYDAPAEVRGRAGIFLATGWLDLASGWLDRRREEMKARLLSFAIALTLALPVSASAQGRMPHKDAGALGAEVGVFLPRQDGMAAGPEIDGFYEYYLTARDSLRVGGGWANPKNEADSNLRTRQLRFGVDLIHNWEGGAVHPFVGAGLGTYFLQPRLNGNNLGDSATKIGGTLLAGVEFFTSNTFAVKGEARYNVVQKSGAYNPSGLSLTFGVKSYF